MTKRDKVFEKEFKESLEECGVWVMRIPDKLYWNGHRILSEETPADFIGNVVIDGDLIALLMECKSTADKSLRFAMLVQHQKEALEGFDSIHDTQAMGFVAINFYNPDNVRKFNKCFIVPIDVWDEYLNGSGRKSIPIKACEEDERIVYCPRCKGSLYDMRPFIEYILEKHNL